MASENELSISANLSNTHIQKLLEDKNKARNYIKSCKNIIKRQTEQLKKQQAEFKNAVSTLETQTFTTRFHSVAFKLELDIMRIINIRRRIDSVLKKKFFLKFVGQVFKSHISEYSKLRSAYALVRSSCESILKYIKNKKKEKLRIGLSAIEYFVLSKDPNSFFGRLDELKKENFLVKAQISEAGKEKNFDDLLEENKKLKEKLKTTEQSVGNFIKEMGSLLNTHEPPGFTHESDSPKPALKGKKGKKPKARAALISPERVELPIRKTKINRVNFD